MTPLFDFVHRFVNTHLQKAINLIIKKLKRINKTKVEGAETILPSSKQNSQNQTNKNKDTDKSIFN